MVQIIFSLSIANAGLSPCISSTELQLIRHKIRILNTYPLIISAYTEAPRPAWEASTYPLVIGTQTETMRSRSGYGQIRGWYPIWKRRDGTIRIRCEHLRHLYATITMMEEGFGGEKILIRFIDRQFCRKTRHVLGVHFKSPVSSLTKGYKTRFPGNY